MLEVQVQLKVVQLKYEISGLLFFLVILFLLSAYATVPLWCLGSLASPTSAWFLTHQNRLCLKHLGSLVYGVGQFPLAPPALPVRWTSHSNDDAIGESANVVTFKTNVSVRMWVYFNMQWNLSISWEVNVCDSAGRVPLVLNLGAKWR